MVASDVCVCGGASVFSLKFISRCKADRIFTKWNSVLI